ncbi:MAG: Ycf66 family protein [Cyanobacteria bacterium J06598_3]
MSFTPVTLLVGIVLILGALGLFFLDKIRPGYARDSDKIYAVLLLISGFLSLGHLTAGVTESFQLMLMGGMLFTLVLESIRNREPIMAEPQNRMPPRPPQRPRYDERPPARRVYRAELDERDPRMDGPYAPRMAPSRDPRMAPARNEYQPNGYEAARPRQPYEEYRGPAGRLQPSQGGPQNSPQGNPQGSLQRNNSSPAIDRYADSRADNRMIDNGGRYGERPPARPPMPSPNQQPLNQQPPVGDGPRNGQFRPNERGPEQRPMNAPQAPESGTAENAGNRERTGNGGRPLSVRPYSEAPKIDLPRDSGRNGDYRPNNQPEGAPSEP